MSRSAVTFQAAFDDLAAALDLAPADVSGAAVLQAALLSRFNAAYRAAYTRRAWEDAWQDASLTPTSRLLTYTQLADARRFEFWTADPRDPDSNAAAIGYVTSGDGVTLVTDDSPVFTFYLPAAPKFTATAYVGATAYGVGDRVLATDGNVYRCIQNGTGQAPASSPLYWTVVPVLEVLKDAVVEMAAALHLMAAGQQGTAERRRAAAEDLLDQAAMLEYPRTARTGGRPWTQPATLTCTPCN